jgi:regulatory protein
MRSSKMRLLSAGELRDYALRLLGARAYSTAELRRKMERRAERKSDVDDLLVQLREHGYLDDRRFAEGFTRARLESRKMGAARVISELRGRRIAPKTAEQAVQNIFHGVDEAALIEAWVRRKYRLAPREGLFQQDKDLASAYGRLRRAGFRSGDIITVLKRFAAKPELLDSFEPPEEEEA